VTERLRIQRGSFLIGPLKNMTRPSDASIEIDSGGRDPLTDDKSWIVRRIEQRGQNGRPVTRRSELFTFFIPGEWKGELRTLLVERSGLDIATVYPTAWNQPQLAQFARAYGRERSLSLDLKVPSES